MTPLYYISFCVLSTFVMLNLVVATLMGELERAGVESSEEEKQEEAGQKPAAQQHDTEAKELSVLTGDKAGVTVDQAQDLTQDGSTLLESTAAMPMLPQAEPSPTEEGPSGGSRVKLDPLPMRPVSPSVFVPFAPETVDNEPEDAGAEESSSKAETS